MKSFLLFFVLLAAQISYAADSFLLRGQEYLREQSISMYYREMKGSIPEPVRPGTWTLKVTREDNSEVIFQTSVQLRSVDSCNNTIAASYSRDKTQIIEPWSEIEEGILGRFFLGTESVFTRLTRIDASNYIQKGLLLKNGVLASVNLSFNLSEDRLKIEKALASYNGLPISNSYGMFFRHPEIAQGRAAIVGLQESSEYFICYEANFTGSKSTTFVYSAEAVYSVTYSDPLEPGRLLVQFDRGTQINATTDGKTLWIESERSSIAIYKLDKQ